MVYIGIDPGKTGAIAEIYYRYKMGDWISSFDVWDMPIKDGKIDFKELNKIFRSETTNIGEPLIAAIERVHAMPKNGSVSMFSFGESFGSVQTAVYAAPAGADVMLVRPQLWKKHFGLIGKDKDSARLLAMDKFPYHVNKFKRKKDIGRADAALIALWAKECLNQDNK